MLALIRTLLGYYIMKGDVRFHLDTWEEAVGILTDIKGRSLIFDNFIVDLYPLKPEFIRKVSGLVGTRVSVIRTDSIQEPYRIKLIS